MRSIKNFVAGVYKFQRPAVKAVIKRQLKNAAKRTITVYGVDMTREQARTVYSELN